MNENGLPVMGSPFFALIDKTCVIIDKLAQLIDKTRVIIDKLGTIIDKTNHLIDNLQE